MLGGALLAIAFSSAAARSGAGIDPGDLAEPLHVLTSDALAGRGTGTPGAEKAARYVAGEFARRDAEVMAAVNGVIQSHPKEWADLSAKIPRLATLPAEAEKELTALSKAGVVVFPALSFIVTV